MPRRTHRPAKHQPARTTYTDEQKTAALAAFQQHGGPAAEHTTGIPRRTITRWARAAGVTSDAPAKTAEAVAQAALTLEQRKQATAARLLTEIGALLDQLHRPVVERKIITLPGKILVAAADDEGEPVLTSGWTTAEVQRAQPTFAEQKTIMVTAAIAVDKVQVLTGGATHRVAFEGEADREVQSVAAEIIQLVDGRRAG